MRAGWVALGIVVAGCGQAPLVGSADRIVIRKAEHQLVLVRRARPLRAYRVALGRNPVGPKSQAGDGRTPEGKYVVDEKRTTSRFHRALHLSYPNAHDRRRARALGTPPGADIEIHGLPAAWSWAGPLHRSIDWTNGCIALTNAEIDEVFSAVRTGTPVLIEP